MKTQFRALLLAPVLSSMLATGASAASITVGADTLPGSNNDFSTELSTVFGAGNLGFGFVKSVNSGLNTLFTFTHWGAESGYNNSFSASNASDTKTISETGYTSFGCGGTGCGSSMSLTFSGLLGTDDWKFTSNKGDPAAIGNDGMGIFYDITGNSAFAFLAYDDDGANKNDNHDDFLVKLEVSSSTLTVSPVPLPAAVWLFGSALLGFVSLSRRRGGSRV